MSRKTAHDSYILSCIFYHFKSCLLPENVSRKNSHGLYILSCVLSENCVAKERTRLIHFLLCSSRKLCRGRTHTSRKFYFGVLPEICVAKECTRLVHYFIGSLRKLWGEILETNCVLSLKTWSAEDCSP